MFTAALLAGRARVRGRDRQRHGRNHLPARGDPAGEEPDGRIDLQEPALHKAWQLIDKAGLRGLRNGAARVSELHCNFLINEGGASSAEIEQLGETVRERVREATGVALEWEIKRIGIEPWR